MVEASTAEEVSMVEELEVPMVVEEVTGEHEASAAGKSVKGEGEGSHA
jgi:hypothetical protein